MLMSEKQKGFQALETMLCRQVSNKAAILYKVDIWCPSKTKFSKLKTV